MISKVNIFELNTQFAIDQSLDFYIGKGGFPFIHINNTHASAIISIYGGQVLSFHPNHTTDDLMFLSDRAYYEQGKAIKGGAPICWPWFGVDDSALNRGAHGFVRNRLWQVVSTTELSDGETEVVLRLNESESTLLLWAHTFTLTIKITVGRALKVELITHNTSDTPMQLTQAIHTYFNVGNIHQTNVLGMEHTQYIDHATGGNQAIKRQLGAITVAEEVDRVYMNTPPTMHIIDEALQRRITIQVTGSCSTVVWNPWMELSIKFADLNDDDYLKFICVETANVADDIVEIMPDAINKLSVTYSIEQP